MDIGKLLNGRQIIALRDKNTPLYEPEELMLLHEIGMKDEIAWNTKEWSERVAENLIKELNKQ